MHKHEDTTELIHFTISVTAFNQLLLKHCSFMQDNTVLVFTGKEIHDT